jgi:tetratricopeptide (TPR) repeat protein
VSVGTSDVAEARVLAARGQRSAALQALERVLEEAPDDVAALVLRGRLLLEEREPAAARRDLERAAALEPGSAEALNGLARCLFVAGAHAEALELAGRARELLGQGDNYVQTGPVYLTIVWCLRELRRYREGLAMVEEGLRRCDDALLAEWASTLEDELAEAERERC